MNSLLQRVLKVLKKNPQLQDGQQRLVRDTPVDENDCTMVFSQESGMVVEETLRAFAAGYEFLSVDLEGIDLGREGGETTYVSIATSQHVYVFWVHENNPEYVAIRACISRLLALPNVLFFFWSCECDIECLQDELEILLLHESIVDVQILSILHMMNQRMGKVRYRPGLAKILGLFKKEFGSSDDGNLDYNVARDEHPWMLQPWKISNVAKIHAARDTITLPFLFLRYARVVERFEKEFLDCCFNVALNTNSKESSAKIGEEVYKLHAQLI